MGVDAHIAAVFKPIGVALKQAQGRLPGPFGIGQGQKPGKAHPPDGQGTGTKDHPPPGNAQGPSLLPLLQKRDFPVLQQCQAEHGKQQAQEYRVIGADPGYFVVGQVTGKDQRSDKQPQGDKPKQQPHQPAVKITAALPDPFHGNTSFVE